MFVYSAALAVNSTRAKPDIMDGSASTGNKFGRIGQENETRPLTLLLHIVDKKTPQEKPLRPTAYICCRLAGET